jgi:hypothetical protein
VQRPDHLKVLRPTLQRGRVDIGTVADQPEAPLGVGLGQLPRQGRGGLGAGLVAVLALLAVEPPEHRQAVVAVGAEWDRHGDAQHDPVEAEPEGLVLLRGEHGVEEDAAEGDLGPTLVTEGVVDHEPGHAAGDQVGEDQCGQDQAQVVPLPGGGMEDGVGGVVVPLGSQAGGLPDLADGARAKADDPTGDERLEGREDLGMETIAKRLYQSGEAGDKLIHRAGLREVCGPGVPEHPPGYRLHA